jgi:hypothetical protein
MGDCFRRPVKCVQIAKRNVATFILDESFAARIRLLDAKKGPQIVHGFYTSMIIWGIR